ncbi:MAG: NADH-ubiquinone oxidoreductase-F iron-sulfur binding region domain-containing protein [Thermodesulfobacteriota bacterium]
MKNNNIVFSNWGAWEKGPEYTDSSRFPVKPLEDGKTAIRAFMGWDGFVLLDDSVSIVDMCRAYMDRARQESCGQCFPCRLGTEEMFRILERICSGKGAMSDLEQLEFLACLVKDTSKCGIGETTPRPLLDALKHYRGEFEKVIKEQKRIPLGSYTFRVTAPCMEACPSNLDIPDYVEKIKKGEYKEALQVIRQGCPLPGTIGRVCVRPCESNCRRSRLDEGLAIRALKRFVADFENHSEEEPQYPSIGKRPAEGKKGKDIAVIGAGPAGLSCAFYLVLSGHRPVIYEALSEPGGMAAVGIPDYRLPRHILRQEVEFIQKLGVEIHYNTRIGRDISIRDLEKKGFSSIFFGVGAPKSASMRCEGEDQGYEGFMTGVEYLHRLADGENPLRGKKIAVVGGGNVAMDCVRSSMRLGFEEVNLLYRRTEEEMPADLEEIKEAKEEGVVFNYLLQPIRIVAENGKVTGLECLRMELGEPDASGRRKPSPVEGSNFILECDAVIPAIGQTCEVDCLLPEDNENLELTRWKSLVVDDISFQSGEDYIFGGGDCITGPATLIEALAAGKKAAKYIDKYLERGMCQADSEDLLENFFSGLELFDPDEKMPYQGMTEKAEPPCMEPEERIKSFREAVSGFNEAEALSEASRCLRCYRIGMALF